jgi:antitoxin YefM
MAHVLSHVSYSQLRNNLASYINEVCDSRAPLVVTRWNARSVVLMSEADCEGLMETVHLLKSPANAARLLRSIDEADRGKLTGRALIEPAKADAAIAHAYAAAPMRRQRAGGVAGLKRPALVAFRGTARQWRGDLPAIASVP